MYVFGGWNGIYTLDDFFEYNILCNQWKSLHVCGTKPPSRYRHTAVVSPNGGRMFVFGGVDKKQDRFHDLWAFNFSGSTWEVVRTSGLPPSPRTFHRACMHNGCMYIFGGFDGNRLNDVWAIDLCEGEAEDEEENEEGADDVDVDDARRMKRENDQLRSQLRELQQSLDKEIDKHLCKVCFEVMMNSLFEPMLSSRSLLVMR